MQPLSAGGMPPVSPQKALFFTIECKGFSMVNMNRKRLFYPNNKWLEKTHLYHVLITNLTHQFFILYRFIYFVYHHNYVNIVVCLFMVIFLFATMVKHYSTSQLCPKPSAAIHVPTQTSDSEASTWTSGSVPSRARVVAWQQQPPPGPARVVAQNLFVLNLRAVSSTPFRKSCTNPSVKKMAT